MNKSGDKALIHRCNKGDRKAFEALVVKYEKPVFNAAYRIDCLKKQNRVNSLEKEPASDLAGPEEAADSEQQNVHLQMALMKIKQEYRTVIVLKHILGCSYIEISEILEIPEKKVKSRLYTARQLLKEALSKERLH